MGLILPVVVETVVVATVVVEVVGSEAVVASSLVAAVDVAITATFVPGSVKVSSSMDWPSVMKLT